MNKFVLIFIFTIALSNRSFGVIEDDEIPENLADDDGDDSSEQVQEIKDSPYGKEDDKAEDDYKENYKVPTVDMRMAAIAFIIVIILLIILWICVLHITGFKKINISKNKVVLCGNRKNQPLLKDVEAPTRSQDPMQDALFTMYNQKYNEATKLLWTINNAGKDSSGKSTNSSVSNPK